MSDLADLAILIPASNEAALIGACLTAVLASNPVPAPVVRLVVIANGCRDNTAGVAAGFAPMAAAKGWDLQVLDLAEGGKTRALAAGETAAPARVTLYLDADVTVSPALLAQTYHALSQADGPAYAAGKVRITAQSFMSRLYARFWQQVPFMRDTVPGCGAFAMNAAGRARFGQWPQIISDDTFVRLHFSPAERIALAAPYDWPIAEGLPALIRVRRRQDHGVSQCAALYPHLNVNADPPPPPGYKRRMALADPLGFLVYAGVAIAVKLRRPDDAWVRSR